MDVFYLILLDHRRQKIKKAYRSSRVRVTFPQVTEFIKIYQTHKFILHLKRLKEDYLCDINWSYGFEFSASFRGIVLAALM